MFRKSIVFLSLVMFWLSTYELDVLVNWRHEDTNGVLMFFESPGRGDSIVFHCGYVVDKYEAEAFQNGQTVGLVSFDSKHDKLADVIHWWFGESTEQPQPPLFEADE